MPKPVWQLVCEFSNGSCVCATTRGEPCDALRAIEHRIKDRVYHDFSETHEMRRKVRP